MMARSKPILDLKRRNFNKFENVLNRNPPSPVLWSALRASTAFAKIMTIVSFTLTEAGSRNQTTCDSGTGHTTCLHVPSVGLVVAGDAAYNDVHLYLAESNPKTRKQWIAALDKIETLKPCAVIAGHKKAEKDDSPRIIEETRQYIRDFERLAELTTTARELYAK